MQNILFTAKMYNLTKSHVIYWKNTNSHRTFHYWLYVSSCVFHMCFYHPVYSSHSSPIHPPSTHPSNFLNSHLFFFFLRTFLLSMLSNIGTCMYFFRISDTCEYFNITFLWYNIIFR